MILAFKSLCFSAKKSFESGGLEEIFDGAKDVEAKLTITFKLIRRHRKLCVKEYGKACLTEHLVQRNKSGFWEFHIRSSEWNAINFGEILDHSAVD